MIPIWKDTYYTTSADTLVYEIADSNTGEILFTGKAYKAPDADTLKVKVNDICSNYLVQPFPIAENEISASSVYATIAGDVLGSVKEFDFNVSSQTDMTYKFYFDWSYKDLSTDTENLTIPYLISNHACTGMFALDVAVNFQDEIYEVEYTNIPAQFRFYGLETGYCGDYVLYYTNRFGAWSPYLIEGSVVERDSFSQSDYTTAIDNNRQLDRAKTRYYNEITHTYEIKTGWLSDSSSRMLAEHLLSSNNVWLHNLKTNKIIPVVITDSNVDYKTFANERKMFGYTLNLEESNKKVIK